MSNLPDSLNSESPKGEVKNAHTVSDRFEECEIPQDLIVTPHSIRYVSRSSRRSRSIGLLGGYAVSADDDQYDSFQE